MKRQVFLFIVAAFHVSTRAQVYLPFEQVRKYTNSIPASKYDSSLTLLSNRLGGSLHYLYPLYQAIGMEGKFKKSMGEKAFNTAFSRMLSFAGDYPMALRYAIRSYDTLSKAETELVIDSVAKLKNIQAVPAYQAIVNTAPFYQVVMINESPQKPLHRVFTISLLKELYQQGYRYLAMEALNNLSNKCLDSVNVFTGYMIMEPVAGELVRSALSIGYQLVAYEDTLAANHHPSQRDSVQAQHLYEVIRRDPGAKILVQASYIRNSEEKRGDYTPMAYWFKKISGIDPLTIDQTGMTEGSEFAYGSIFHDYFTSRFTISEASVIYQDKRPFNPLLEKGYDLLITHPVTRFQHNRPSWYDFRGERKVNLVQPTEQSLFLVQAYYEKEYTEDLLPYLVPADQTYTSNREGYYCLFLRPGRYKLVLRDVGYKVLSVKNLEVSN